MGLQSRELKVTSLPFIHVFIVSFVYEMLHAKYASTSGPHRWPKGGSWTTAARKIPTCSQGTFSTAQTQRPICLTCSTYLTPLPKVDPSVKTYSFAITLSLIHKANTARED